MNINNQAMQLAVGAGKTKECELMGMIRAVYYYASIYNVHYNTVFIPTFRNSAADTCSRKNIAKLRQVLPTADISMTKIRDYILDF